MPAGCIGITGTFVNTLSGPGVGCFPLEGLLKCPAIGPFIQSQASTVHAGDVLDSVLGSGI